MYLHFVFKVLVLLQWQCYSKVFFCFVLFCFLKIRTSPRTLWIQSAHSQIFTYQIFPSQVLVSIFGPLKVVWHSIFFPIFYAYRFFNLANIMLWNSLFISLFIGTVLLDFVLLVFSSLCILLIYIVLLSYELKSWIEGFLVGVRC